MTTMRYVAPASKWTERMPLGDGNLGAMADGDPFSSSYLLNHQHGWSGSPTSEHDHGKATAEACAQALARAREAVDRGCPAEAARALQPLQARYSQAFMPLAELTLQRSAESRRYRRELDLATGTHAVRTDSYVERALISHPFGVLAIRTTDAPTVTLASPLQEHRRETEGTDTVVWLRFPADVPPPHEETYVSQTWSEGTHDGVEAVVVTRVERHADGGLTILVAAATTYVGLGRPLASPDRAERDARELIARASAAGFDAVLDAGARDHAHLFSRSRLTFVDKPVRADRSGATDARLARAFDNPDHPLATDPGLASLAFDFGRYLLISSSRAGGLPATLQGIWNSSMRPPWSSNFTLNINTQMNYWSVHSTGLSELAEPLETFVTALADAGRETASRLYGAPGWAAHHNSDAWLFSSPVGGGHGDARWAHWPMAGAWLVCALWDGVRFGAGDAARLWPVARGAAEFALAWHHERRPGEWVTSPSTSPENTYLVAGVEAAIDDFTEMDRQLLSELFTVVVELAGRVGCADDDVARQCERRLTLLAGSPRISSAGSVNEWSTERVDADPQHRHLSHLYQLFPGSGRWDDDARHAAARTLELRGDESTGWSLVWKLGLWARLRRPDKVADLLALVFRDADADRGDEAGGLYANMFAAHPPFQIDANLGLPGVLAECFLQSHDGIELLPAVPKQLANGSAKGLVARPGVLVDLEWSDGHLVTAVLTPRRPCSITLRYRSGTRPLELFRPMTLGPDDFPTATTAGVAHA